jgi:hypothetical protein
MSGGEVLVAMPKMNGAEAASVLKPKIKFENSR